MTPAAESVPRKSTAPLLVFGLGVVFWPRLQWIAQLWALDSLYSASALVPVICIAITYLKRRRIQQHNCSTAGLLLFAIAVLATTMLDVTQVRIYSATPLLLVVAISGIIVAAWGWQALRILAFPVLFLLFLVPIPPSMVARVDYPLQEMCARIAVTTGQLAGIHTWQLGAMLLFADPLVSVDVAPACNGLRSALAMLITAVLYIYLVRGGWYRKVAILAAAVPLAYLANFVRLFGVIWFMNRAGPKSAGLEPVWDHATGLLLFAAAVLTLFLWARVLKCNRLREIG